MTIREIDCEQALKRVFDFIDRELDEVDHEVMRRHLETCKSCFSRMEFERRLKEKLARLPDEPPTDKLTERVNVLLQGFQ